ncbi:cysteine-rich CWC family protein [Leptospira tipperaryensis]
MDSIKSEVVHKPCPRCGSRFECGAAIDSCACFSVNLSPEAKKIIQENYVDCLCVPCLQELNSSNSK